MPVCEACLYVSIHAYMSLHMYKQVYIHVYKCACFCVDPCVLCKCVCMPITTTNTHNVASDTQPCSFSLTIFLSPVCVLMCTQAYSVGVHIDRLMREQCTPVHQNVFLYLMYLLIPLPPVRCPPGSMILDL